MDQNHLLQLKELYLREKDMKNFYRICYILGELTVKELIRLSKGSVISSLIVNERS